MRSWPHFAANELRCSCGKCTGDMDTDFMRKLEKTRKDIQRPLVLSSAYRCPHYNNEVSETGFTGPHTTGRAVDILIYGEDAYDLIDLAYEHGMTGVGIKQHGVHKNRFVHLDDLDHKSYNGPRPWVWSYT